MARTGRPRTPTKLKLVSGNPGRRPLNRNEPEPAAIDPKDLECPAHLTAAARAEWQRIAQELAGLGLLTRLDRANMTGYCQAWADYLEAQGHLDAEAKVFSTKTGYPVPSPWLAIKQNALNQMRSFGNELGLSAPARTRIDVGDKKKSGEEDPAAKYFGS